MAFLLKLLMLIRAAFAGFVSIWHNIRILAWGKRLLAVATSISQWIMERPIVQRLQSHIRKHAKILSFILFSPHLWPFSETRRIFLLGVCATLTLPPFYIFPLAIPAYGGLFFLLRRASCLKEALRIGFLWGWGFYISGLYWLVIALMTDLDKFAWLMPLALFGLTAVIALYTSLFAGLFFKITRYQPRYFTSSLVAAGLFTLLWTAVEYLRGHLFGGFPWNLGGYVFAASDASIQAASLVGIYGLTAATVWLAVVSYAHRKAAYASWMLLLLLLAWGDWRADTAPRRFVEGVNLRLVQANIQQHHKWDPALQMQGMRAYMELTRDPGIERVTHVIWPETAVPYVLEEGSTLALRLGFNLLPTQHLLTGALRSVGKDITNSLVVIDMNGKMVGNYQKHKLVPFGEFLPLRWLIPDWLETPVGMSDMLGGDGPKTLSFPRLPPVSPLICYEAIFPEDAARKDDRPSWLLSITNDAWFGTSTAPYQHLAMARMRAVEQGLPLVRVANTGISAVYDGYGRELARLPLNQRGVLDSKLPLPVGQR